MAMDPQPALMSGHSEGPGSSWLEQRYFGLSGLVWARIGIIAGLMVALFWPNLRRLWLKTNPFNGEANWQHSIFVPLIGLYYLYLNREALLSDNAPKLSPQVKALGAWTQVQVAFWGAIFFLVYAYVVWATPHARMLALTLGSAFSVLALAVMWALPHSRSRSSAVQSASAAVQWLADTSAIWFGAYCMLWGILLFAWGIWPGQNDFFKDVGLVATLFGAVLLACGWGVMRITWFPILFLLCAIPWSYLMYSAIAMPLQKLAAGAAAYTMSATGVIAARNGTQIVMGVGAERRVLDVAQACAGLKSLMTFIAVAAAVGFLSTRAMWQKILITLSAVPIAVFCNMMRVAGQGLLDHYWSRELSMGFAHQFVGMFMLIPAFFLILFVAWVLDHIFVEEADKRELSRGAAKRKDLVIDIPRSRAKATASMPAAVSSVAVSPASPAPSSAANDLAAATQRLMASGPSRRIRPAPRVVTPAPKPPTGGAAADPPEAL